MSISRILQPSNLLSGTRIVRTDLRPRIVAYLVPDDSIALVARLVASLSITWGGALHPIIPVKTGERIRAEWIDILDRLDPDSVEDVVGLVDEDKQALRERGWFVSERSDALGDGPIVSLGIPIYSIWDAVTSAPKGVAFPPNHILVKPAVAQDDPLYLPTIARHGLLNENIDQFKWIMDGDPRKRKVADYFRVESMAMRGNEQLALVGGPISIPSLIAEGGVFHFHRLLDETRRAISSSGPIYPPMMGSPGPVDPIYIAAVVVTGSSTSVQDFCLYWNLRVVRQHADPYPLWLPLDILDSDHGPSLIREASRQTHRNVGSYPSERFPLHLVSASVSSIDLEARLRQRFPDAVISSDHLGRFISDHWTFTMRRDERDVYFDGGRAQVPVPDDEWFEFLPPHTFLTTDSAIDGVVLPGGQDLFDMRPPLPASMGVRVTRRGTLERLVMVQPLLTRHFDVSVPSGWNVLQSVFARQGYDCKPTSKSQITIRLIEFFRQSHDIQLLQSSRVYDMLNNLSRGTDETEERPLRHYLTARRHASYSELSQLIGSQFAKDVAIRLVQRGILFRGAVLPCPQCGLRLWYELNRINSTWRCDGCLQELPVPLQPTSTNWAYRINELYAAGHDQGAITPLLTMLRLNDDVGWPSENSMGYFPSVELTANGRVSVPINHVEIDLAVVSNGRLTIAECKESGHSLAMSEVEKMVEIGVHLDAERILFVTPTSFDDTLTTQGDSLSASRTPVEWWERGDVLDYDARSLRGNVNDVTDDPQRAEMFLAKTLSMLSESWA